MIDVQIAKRNREKEEERFHDRCRKNREKEEQTFDD